MRFTIVTVCYNSRRTIAETIASVAEQDLPDYEHLIIDGASTDGTLDVVRQHEHDRLTLFSEPDHGIYDAMNKGLDRAAGDYVLFLNSDDTMARSDALSLVSEMIDQTGADCIFASTTFVQTDGAAEANRIYSVRGFRPWWLRVGIMPPHPSAFIRRDLMRRCGGFDTSYRNSADFDLIARILLKEKASWAVLEAVIARFRLGGNSTSGLAKNISIGRELGRSLAALNQPLAPLAVQLRFPLKLSQFRLRGTSSRSGRAAAVQDSQE